MLRNARVTAILCASALACLGGTAATSAADNQKVRASATSFQSTSEVLIHYKAGQADDAKAKADAAGFEVLENYKPGKYLRCARRPGIAAVAAAVNTVAVSEAVRLVEPNYIVRIPTPPSALKRAALPRVPAAEAVTPNDPGFPKLWGMKDIHAPDAWVKNHDTPSVIVGVVDTGVDYNHEDLHANMWRNPDEIPGNGKDDDGNGIIDDVYGVKYENGVGSGDPMDDNEHGTHCSGTIGAVGNNGIGVVGVTWKVQIMALKFLRANGSGATDDAVKCIDYAIAKKANILSNSWGGGGFSQALQDAIERAKDAGILFVVAAGNEGTDNDSTPSYPASYPNPNILAVAAINPDDQLSFFSNFGKDSVDLGAPGGRGSGDQDDILSTLPGNRYGFLAGTSMATPHVSGAAALVLANPRFSTASGDSNYQKIKKLLMDNARSLPGLAGKCVTGGTLDIRFLANGR